MARRKAKRVSMVGSATLYAVQVTYRDGNGVLTEHAIDMTACSGIQWGGNQPANPTQTAKIFPGKTLLKLKFACEPTPVGRTTRGYPPCWWDGTTWNCP